MPKSADKPFDWKRKGAEKALALCFEGRWTQDEIAKKCGISARTYWSWLTHPEFQARLEALRADFAASVRDEIYADKARRVIGLSQMAESARREYEERPWLQEVRQVGFDRESGEPLTLTNESFNAQAHAAFRASLDDIAKELGQRANKVDVTAQLHGNVTHDLNLALDGDAAAFANAFLRRLAAHGAGDASGSGVSGE